MPTFYYGYKTFTLVCLICLLCVLIISTIYNSYYVYDLGQSVNRLKTGIATDGDRYFLTKNTLPEFREMPLRPLKFVQNKDPTFDYLNEMDKLNEARADQHDNKLIKLIRDYYIVPPSEEPYNLNDPNSLDYSIGQAPFVDSRLNYKEDGFYVECGAHNGERGTNTLFFEKVRKWNGLLIEADPNNFKVLKSKHRKAFLLNACLNTEPYPAMKTFNMASNMGRIAESEDAKKWINQKHIKTNEVRVQCFPLYSILRALDQLTIDFFSLDVEGDELPVLQTIPWEKVNITMMTVEIAHGAEGARSLRTYILGKGYDDMLNLSRFDGRANDLIVRKKGFGNKVTKTH